MNRLVDGLKPPKLIRKQIKESVNLNDKFKFIKSFKPLVTSISEKKNRCKRVLRLAYVNRLIIPYLHRLLATIIPRDFD